MQRRMKNSTGIRVRAAVAADAVPIANVHYSAVQHVAASAYPSAVINAWAKMPDETRYQEFASAISGDRERLFVAEDETGIVAFGALVPAKCEVRAVYVHALVCRRGVGTAILHKLEFEALGYGCRILHLEASVNSESFYRKNGYEVIRQAFHQLSGGLEMKCLIMKKPLASAD